MKNRIFLTITFLTILFYFMLRIIGWHFWADTNWWKVINNDNWHHYQLGLLLIIVSLTIFYKRVIIKDLLQSVGAGMVIDESMFAFNMSHYAFDGIIFEIIVLILFSIFILKFKSSHNARL